MFHRFEIHCALELCARLYYATASQPLVFERLLVGYYVLEPKLWLLLNPIVMAILVLFLFAMLP